MRRLWLAVGLVVLAGCSSATAPSSSGRARSTTVPVVSVPSSCHATADGGGTVSASNVLPDRRCTPGVVNPAVTQATIRTTICVSGWTSTVRPPTSYTDRLKVADIKAYGDYAGVSTGGYELDHLVPLSSGGAPADPANLWPEADNRKIPNPKDEVEFAAQRAVCSGRMTLAAVQHGFEADWVTLGHELGVKNP